MAVLARAVSAYVYSSTYACAAYTTPKMLKLTETVHRTYPDSRPINHNC